MISYSDSEHYIVIQIWARVLMEPRLHELYLVHIKTYRKHLRQSIALFHVTKLELSANITCIKYSNQVFLWTVYKSTIEYSIFQAR